MVSKWISGSLTGGPASLRRVHRSLTLRALAQQPGIGRTELAEQLGLSFMAIGRIVRELEQAGLTIDSPAKASTTGRGRPATGLKLRSDGAYVAGVVISAFSREAHLLDMSGNPVASTEVSIEEITDGPKAVSIACKAINRLIKKAKVPTERIVGAGFAVAANVNLRSGAVVGGGYLNWSPFEMAEQASEQLNMPVTVNNIGDALLRAEAFTGCARKASSAVLIHASTTLGASHITADQLHNGTFSKAGRIGHFPMQATQRVCSCGQTDCLNCVASGWSVLCQLNSSASPIYQFKHIRRYSDQTRALVAGTIRNKARAEKLVLNAGSALAQALRYLDLTNDPELIILSGPLSRMDSYLNGVRQGLADAGPPGKEVLEKIVTGAVSPAQAAGVTAMLDTAFSPTLDLQTLSDTAIQEVSQGQR
jgi:predicted NBD/HSP70 family sugar kinase